MICVALEGISPVRYSGMPREVRVNGRKPEPGKAVGFIVVTSKFVLGTKQIIACCVIMLK
jgi:hypothetical protein